MIKARYLKENSQVYMTNAEVRAVALTAARFLE
jgi:hypothetical protein